MKYLKYVLGTLAALIIGFILIGIIKPTVDYECEIMVDKPLAEAWAVAQDPEKMADWLAGFQRVEHISGTPGAVGSVSNVHFDTDGQEMSIRETITEIVPNESIAMLFESDFMNMDYDMALSAVDGKTRISTSTSAVGNNILSKSLMALMGGSLKGQEDTNLVNLKNTIEQNQKDYFPVIEEPTEESEE